MKVHRLKITIYGLVQGVGFRPFVAEQAEALGLAGMVQNMGGIVRIFAEGKKEALDEFIHRLSACAPEGARVDRVEVSGVSKEDLWKEIHVRNQTGQSQNNKFFHGQINESGQSPKNKSYQNQNNKINQNFFIIESEPAKDALRFLPPDIATCDFCRRELFEKKNRRYRYPFISCTSCGPRFSIMERVPYDRDTITMRDFSMCPECRQEYLEKGNKRRHAQTIACKKCGPEVRLLENAAPEFDCSNDLDKHFDEPQKENSKKKAEKYRGEDAIERSIRLLKQGKILAVKDIGGFHFALDPKNREAVERLREFKNRERKPFAVMFPELSDIEAYCEVSETEKNILCSDARPIVLLKKKRGMDFVPEVCGESRYMGAMLPCNPLQMLLLQGIGPLVMTSGNRGGEPIITDEEDMLKFWQEEHFSGTMLQMERSKFWQENYFSGAMMQMENGFGEITEKDRRKSCSVPDAVLTHDRRILYGLDDSIFQVTSCGEREVVQVIRRARGFVPEPVRLPKKFPVDTFAAGGDLKAVFALGRENMAYLSAHFGDLEDVQAAKKRVEALKGMCTLLGISPVHAVCDKHPGYYSAKHVEEDIQAVWKAGVFHTEYLLKHERPKENVEKHSYTNEIENIENYSHEKTGIISIRKIQHHHAHIAAVMAEYSLKGRVLGVAYDGTGYGEDGTVWGGEFLLCEERNFKRAGHLESVLLTGGDASSKNAMVTAYCYLSLAKEKGYLSETEMEKIISCLNHETGQEEKKLTLNQRKILDAARKNHINTVFSSSMGRLFDAAAAVLGICMENSFEGECPAKLEAQAEQYLENSKRTREPKRAEVLDGTRESKQIEIPLYVKDGAWIADGSFLLASLAKARLNGEAEEKLAYEFHRSIAQMTINMCENICQNAGGENTEKNGRISSVENTEKISRISPVGENTEKISRIALGGGTMYNRLLLKLLIPELEKKGYEVYVNRKVPSGDGGLAYGQLVLG